MVKIATHTFNNIKKLYSNGEMIITFLDTKEIVSLKANGIYLARKPNIPLGKRNIKIIQTIGRTGFLPIDYKTSAPIEFDIELSAIHRTDEARESTRALLERTEGRILDMEFYSDPYAKYRGFITNIDYENNRGRSQLIKAKVHVQPYRIFHSNIVQQVVTSGDTLSFNKGVLNTTLILEGSGKITISYGGKTITLDNVPSGVPITIDNSNEKIYRRLSTNAITNYQHLKVGKGYLDFNKSGKITTTGTITKLTIIPEWRSI